METIEQIKADEGGYKEEVYLCSKGKLTWLCGRNIEDRPITDREWKRLKHSIKAGLGQKHWADVLFDIEISNLDNFYWATWKHYADLPMGVKNIILNMGYNMGTTKFNHHKWPKFFKAIRVHDWRQASIQGRDSKWFRQVGGRSLRLMKSLENFNCEILI